MSKVVFKNLQDHYVHIGRVSIPPGESRLVVASQIPTSLLIVAQSDVEKSLAFALKYLDESVKSVSAKLEDNFDTEFLTELVIVETQNSHRSTMLDAITEQLEKANELKLLDDYVVNLEALSDEALQEEMLSHFELDDEAMAGVVQSVIEKRAEENG